MIINDRRQHALGGQVITGKDRGGYNNGRNYSDIEDIVWHYTGVARRLNRFITGHEAYWKSKNWSRGGYGYYIDAQARIWQNYDDRRITFGAGNINRTAINISVEANSKGDYSQAQIEARDWLTRHLMEKYNIPASRVIGHKEAPGQSTSCPGYSVSELNSFRSELAKPKHQDEKDTIEVDKKIPLEVAIHQLNFETSQWGTKLIDVKGTFKVGHTRIMTRFNTPNIKSPQGGWAQPGRVQDFDQIALVGGFAWLRYWQDGNIKYLPFAEYLNGKVGEYWGEFV